MKMVYKKQGGIFRIIALEVTDRKKEYEKNQNDLFVMLDKGIDDLKSGRTVEQKRNHFC